MVYDNIVIEKLENMIPSHFQWILPNEDKMQDSVYHDSQDKFIIWDMKHLSNDLE